ncbi:MAG TPA: NUDIX domain-containing protein [Rhodocyclaceae bacterium]|nr:NUDIX hydrolase [Rhodocyclaceae bacterium]HNA04781.1 NUDIX domain-containing protein [Rhodocyclaceae bacterium]HNB77562.1 NUDIX domain-containing protein [Rhodocyclaceae bacterium]HNC62938.1 NUDIX domain-containing protein [Rhodocyclaceae bacterium]HNH12343.1 NUDIX domain-containing protein [Rhodocyclaceae bacterium]
MIYLYCPRCASPLAETPLGGQIRMACSKPACGFVHWDNPVPVVAALIECTDRDGQVLLARNAEWTQRFFALITGFLERAETPEDGIRREIAEEVNLQTESLELIGLYPFERMNQIIIAYHARCHGEIRLNEELVETILVPPGKLRPWPAATGLAVRDWMLKRGLTPPPWEGPPPNPRG